MLGDPRLILQKRGELPVSETGTCRAMRDQPCDPNAGGEESPFLSFASDVSSVLPQCDDWINRAGAPSWKITGEQSGEQQQPPNRA